MKAWLDNNPVNHVDNFISIKVHDATSRVLLQYERTYQPHRESTQTNEKSFRIVRFYVRLLDAQFKTFVEL